jgi:hypothetical protein
MCAAWAQTTAAAAWVASGAWAELAVAAAAGAAAQTVRGPMFLQKPRGEEQYKTIYKNEINQMM